MAPELGQLISHVFGLDRLLVEVDGDRLAKVAKKCRKIPRSNSGQISSNFVKFFVRFFKMLLASVFLKPKLLEHTLNARCQVGKA